MTFVKEDVVPPQDNDERNLFADYRRKQIRIPPPRQVREVMSQLLAKRGYAQVQTAATCESAWREAVGEKLAGDTRPGHIRRGVLEVLVRNSVALQELSFVKSKVVRTLKQLIPEQQIRDVKFRVGALD